VETYQPDNVATQARLRRGRLRTRRLVAKRRFAPETPDANLRVLTTQQ
jgi:hypothetical protein